MQVILHAGAHCTDEDKLVKCLLRNKDMFRQRGIAVPGPSRYRKFLRDTIGALKETTPAPGARDVLVDAILETDPQSVDRMLLSNENFFAVPKIALSGGRLYPMAVHRLQRVIELFAGDEVELFLGLRNPATWLPAVYDQTPHKDFETFLNATPPLDLRWSELVARLRQQIPSLPITVWCNEDTPLIWGQIVREMAGLNPNEKITGAFDILSSIMSREGMKRFRAYLKQHPDLTEIQKRRVMTAFLDKFYLEDEVEEVLDIPGWTDELIEHLTDLYEDDMTEIARLPGVTFIAP